MKHKRGQSEDLAISDDLGGNSPKFLYSVNGVREMRPGSSDDSELEIPKSVESLFLRNHPEDTEGNGEGLEQFTKQYLTVVKQLRQLCSEAAAGMDGGKAKHSRRKTAGRKLPDVYKMLCSNIDD